MHHKIAEPGKPDEFVMHTTPQIVVLRSSNVAVVHSHQPVGFRLRSATIVLPEIVTTWATHLGFSFLFFVDISVQAKALKYHKKHLLSTEKAVNQDKFDIISTYGKEN